MKVVTPKEMKRIEEMAYELGFSEEDFCEEAGSGVALFVHDFAERKGKERKILLLCGKGNNGADAFVAGIHLLHLEYDVTAYLFYPLGESSSLCQRNGYRFQKEEGKIFQIEDISEVSFEGFSLIIDGLLGTGFEGALKEPLLSLIQEVNESDLPVFSIDIPSGLEGFSGKVTSHAIKACETIFLSLPKRGFFLEDGFDYTGRLRFIDFGLPKEALDEAENVFDLLTLEEIKPFLPKRKRSAHKYERGHVVGIAGSFLFPGAAVISSFAAFRGGAGIVHLLHPEEITPLLYSAPFELIKVPFSEKNKEEVYDFLEKSSAFYIGPGLGEESLLKDFIKKKKLPLKPCVIDADALFFFNEKNPFPKNAVLTPHKGELTKLLGLEKNTKMTLKDIELCQDFVDKKEVILVVKGGVTFIFSKGHKPKVHSAADIGLATAGSGDVLTGLITGLLAQGLPPLKAACLGVFMHGMSGEICAAELSSYSYTSWDILERLPDAYFSLENLN